MRARRLAELATILVALFVLSVSAHAAAVTVGPVVITVPEGFAAAQTQKQKKTLITAWTKSVRNGSLKTLLQINVIDFGSPPGKPAATRDQAIYAERYLRQFLGGIERRRTNYVSSPLAHIELAGLPALRATWNGAVGGRPVVGVMYSVIVENKYAVIFHTQDLGSTPSSGMFEAMQAIEAATLAAASAASFGMS
ncbi:MAG TPA: hypothetical protein VNO35_35975 [Steroidobacteraceae bacterium]|nr:hypothetical protein [Steroidobacteraceae bacterium]